MVEEELFAVFRDFIESKLVPQRVRLHSLLRIMFSSETGYTHTHTVVNSTLALWLSG